ncbi:hypothetical protein PV420_37305 [Streptomyces europaeiscabiei]|nr:hypothetical protein [Streptomyces europaeiscabiei]MDX2529744.1 hypothetical protein [Streptomyces europaeiscabiei]MDX3779190.1 hypothetical protein [Streptomyces europaeiscabiei]MDX3836265.1 hypothetical protein [Streptomyces europaeiscabiei]MDX3845402.1 hypothetical protein [Streptomyces europaeiscabiei]
MGRISPAAYVVLGPDGTDGAEGSDAFVEDVGGRSGARCVHDEVGEHLQQVVLDHVAQAAGRIVEAAAVGHVEVLGHGDLDAAYEAAVQDGVDGGVAEAEGQQVLDDVLGEEVVDAAQSFLAVAAGLRALLGGVRL